VKVLLILQTFSEYFNCNVLTVIVLLQLFVNTRNTKYYIRREGCSVCGLVCRSVCRQDIGNFFVRILRRQLDLGDKFYSSYVRLSFLIATMKKNC